MGTGKQGPLGPNQRWSARRSRDAVLRSLQHEPLDALSREPGVEIYRLEAWRKQALLGMETALKKRDGDPLSEELTIAKQHIGELSAARLMRISTTPEKQLAVSFVVTTTNGALRGMGT